MKAVKCELCGSGDLVKTDGMFVCQHCGTKYTPEEASKLFVTFKLDKTQTIEGNRTLARRAMQIEDVVEALRYYDMLLSDEPNNWEAYYFSTICRARLNSNPNEEEKYVMMLGRSILSTIHLIVQFVMGREQQEYALMIVLNSLNKYIYDRTRKFAGNSRRERISIGLSSAFLSNLIAAYGELYNSYTNAVDWNFKGISHILAQADRYYYDYIDEYKSLASWRYRREVIKKTKYLFE